MPTCSPALIVWPRSSVSRVQVRANWITGEVQRRISSTAVSTASGSSMRSFSRSSWSRCSSKAITPPLAALRVVSLPAAIIRRR